MRYMSNYRPYQTSLPGEINLRAEFIRLLEHDQKGHWVILRQFDMSRPTKNLNPLTKEAVGGPAYEYTDRVVLCRKSGGSSNYNVLGSQETFTEIGLLDDTQYRFYFAWDVNPRPSDIIYEVEYRGSGKPSGLILPYKDKWNITTVAPQREMEFGRIEYWICLVTNEMHK